MSDSLEQKKELNEEAAVAVDESAAETEESVSEDSVPADKETQSAEKNTENAEEPIEEVEAEPVPHVEILAASDANTITMVEEKKKKSKKTKIIILSSVAAALIIAVVAVICILNYRSPEVVKVDNQILEIGTVTLDSGSKISEAESAVKGLKKGDQEKLENLSKLKDARKKFNSLYNQKEAESIIALIEKIDLSKKGCGKAIEAAREAYSTSTDAVKKLVTNYDKLDNAEKEYNAVDLAYVYDKHCDSTWATLSEDETTLELDTNPFDIDDGSTYSAARSMLIDTINKDLNLPEVLSKKMYNTRAIDGRQTETYGIVEISWTYHPDKGLEIIYAKN